MTTKKAPLLPEIEEIVAAWYANDLETAIALTNQFAVAKEMRFCKGMNFTRKHPLGILCGARLATQARGDYCKHHKHQDPLQKQRVANSKKKSRGTEADADTEIESEAVPV